MVTNAGKSNYIHNPVSGRWVKRNARTGKLIVELTKVICKKKTIRKKKPKSNVTSKEQKEAERKMKAGEFSTYFQDKVAELAKRYGIDDEPRRLPKVNELPQKINTLKVRRRKK